MSYWLASWFSRGVVAAGGSDMSKVHRRRTWSRGGRADANGSGFGIGHVFDYFLKGEVRYGMAETEI